MKKLLLILILFLSGFILIGCQITNNTNTNVDSSTNSDTDISGSTTDVEIVDDEVTDSFQLVNQDGEIISSNNNIYTINLAGSYTASGKLENGQIYIDASGYDVEIILEDVSISNNTKAPIYAYDCDSLTVKAKKDTTNYIYDNRTTDYSTSDTEAQAAIYVENGNLKISGQGTLSITSLANSGIQSKDNVTIKNLTLLVKAVNNGIKGNDKVTIEENPTIGIVAGNNGIRTSNSDQGSSAQHGYIYIYGGTITINSYGDAIDAAYAVEIATSTDTDGVTYTPVIDIYTNKYSSYSVTNSTSNLSSTINLGGRGPAGGGGFGGGGFGGGTSAEKADDSAKGIKANEYIKIDGGEIFIYAYDDGIHTNNDTLDTGIKASASITVSNGTIKIKCSDDGIHADGTLTISGGEIIVSEAHEGIEANIITISGGLTTVVGNDDGVNASKQINISGGRLDVTVSPNGDTDGIDSNGSITISGGTVIARGPNNMNMAAIDADGSIKVSSGIVIVIGYASLSTNLTKTTSSAGSSSGSHTVTVGSTTITYNNMYSYSGQTYVYASSSATIK